MYKYALEILWYSHGGREDDGRKIVWKIQQIFRNLKLLILSEKMHKNE